MITYQVHTTYMDGHWEIEEFCALMSLRLHLSELAAQVGQTVKVFAVYVKP